MRGWWSLRALVDRGKPSHRHESPEQLTNFDVAELGAGASLRDRFRASQIRKDPELLWVEFCGIHSVVDPVARLVHRIERSDPLRDASPAGNVTHTVDDEPRKRNGKLDRFLRELLLLEDISGFGPLEEAEDDGADLSDDALNQVMRCEDPIVHEDGSEPSLGRDESAELCQMLEADLPRLQKVWAQPIIRGGRLRENHRAIVEHDGFLGL